MSALIRLLRHPPRLWAPLLLHRAGTLARRFVDARKSTFTPTYSPVSPRPLRQWLDAPPADLIESACPWLPSVSRRFLDHRFDWLGLGWHRVGYDAIPPGLLGVRYMLPLPVPDREGAWLADRVSEPNLVEAQRLWRCLAPNYQPIDWQRDHRSGYRWDMGARSDTLALYPCLGADVKQPWELARLQHLPLLAMAHYGSRIGLADYEPSERYVDEFTSTVYDFLATNPPQFGINWSCSMDVAIRLVNLLVATDLFIAGGALLDDAFRNLVARATAEHASHIRRYLEKRPDFRANHYLANLAGLLFAGAYLDPSGTGGEWWSFSKDEMCREICRQFSPDGTNFEASTSYHRLSGEIAVWSLALICAVEGTDIINTTLCQRLVGIADFVRKTIRADGSAPAIGDLDNGRLLKLSSDYCWKVWNDDLARNRGLAPDLAEEGHWEERLECHAHVAMAADCFFASATSGAQWESPETWLLRRWVGSGLQIPPPVATQTPQDWSAAVAKLVACGSHPQRRYLWSLPDGDDPQLTAYPDFGLYVVRGRDWLLTLRCGNNGQDGNGGHAHNDQLSLTLEISGRCLVDDPGMAIYNALPLVRMAYRSVAAHFAPRPATGEPASLSLDPFRLPSGGEGRCLYFGPAGFVGAHDGFGQRVARVVTWDGGRLIVEDYADGIILTDLLKRTPDGDVWRPSIPHARRYGYFPVDALMKAVLKA